MEDPSLEKLLISDEDMAEIKTLYKRALSDRDEQAIQLLAAEAMQASMYRGFIAEAQAALELGEAEAVEVLKTMGIAVAEAAEPIRLLSDE